MPKKTKKPNKKSSKKKSSGKSIVPVDSDFDESKALIEAVGGDMDLAVFFSYWIKFGRDSSKAYLKMHPNVTKESARVLGCRMLQKVNPAAILESYNLGIDEYMDQLKEGIGAVVYETEPYITMNKKGQSVTKYRHVAIPDHKTRRHYHRALGELHKLEGQSQPSIQVNQNNLQQNNNIESLPDEDLDLFLNR